MMATMPTAPRSRPLVDRHHARTMRSLLAICGSMIALLGVVVAGAGSISPSGSTFFIIMGFGLILSGALLARRNLAGAWSFMAVFVATVLWSLANVQSGGFSLAYGLIGPFALLIMIGALMPALGRMRPRPTIAVCVSLMIATVTVGILASDEGEPLEGPTVAEFPADATKGVLQ